MKYCQKCNKEYSDSIDFCPNCGLKLEYMKCGVKYVGETERCKNCNAVIPSHTVECPNCHVEIRRSEVSITVNEFFSILQTKDGEEKISFIREFPLPSNREDLIEFAIFAKTNILYNDLNNDGKLTVYESSITNAWKIKFEQCYTKAKIMLNSEDLLVFEDIATEIRKKEEKDKADNELANFKKTKSNLFSIIGLIWSSFWCFVAAVNSSIPCTLISVVQILLFILVLLTGRKIVKCNVKGIHVALVIVGWVLTVPFFIFV